MNCTHCGKEINGNIFFELHSLGLCDNCIQKPKAVTDIGKCHECEEEFTREEPGHYHAGYELYLCEFCIEREIQFDQVLFAYDIN